MKSFDFSNLFILDLANNHQGRVDHGLKVIRSAAEVCRSEGVRAAMKFQFRQLDTFIHPLFKDRKDIKHIPRFTGTRLAESDFKILFDEIRKQGLITMCTPFDEESVDQIIKMGFDIIKVASCSATDRPLLEKIAKAGLPVVASTAGANMNQIDQLVSIFKDYGTHFALMHCVAIYPTPTEKLNLNQIGVLMERFPGVPIGFSTHEDQDNTTAIQIAYAKGARLFERHVDHPSDFHKMNAYSSTPEQLRKWIQGYKNALASCGVDQRAPASLEEIESLHSLMRGVFVKNPIKKGDVVKRENVFFAMPLQPNQMTSGEWHEGLIADQDYEPLQPLNGTLANIEPSQEEQIYRIMLQVKGMLNKARISIGKDSSVEISHHYGLERFREFGAVIVTCINRNYCKKIVVQLPRQKHPYHLHKKKEETFQLLYGDLEVEIDGQRTRMNAGDTLLVGPNQWHKFHTLDGAIFEEVSTRHYDDDSFYEDEKLARMPRVQRKTFIPNWEAATHHISMT